MKNKLILLLSILFLISCKNNRNEKSENFVDYSDKTVLDSLIKSTSQSKDTLFLGFTFGMTKANYKNHIEKIKKEGKTITFSKSNKYSTIAGTFDLGEGYTFETSISAKNYDKTITGFGKYFLEPVFNQNGELSQLNILTTEKWNDNSYSSDRISWFENKVDEKYGKLNNEGLKKALIDNEIVNSFDSVWQQGNLIIYETSLTINYVDLNTLLVDLLLKELEKEVIEKQNNDVKI